MPRLYLFEQGRESTSQAKSYGFGEGFLRFRVSQAGLKGNGATPCLLMVIMVKKVGKHEQNMT